MCWTVTSSSCDNLSHFQRICQEIITHTQTLLLSNNKKRKKDPEISNNRPNSTDNQLWCIVKKNPSHLFYLLCDPRLQECTEPLAPTFSLVRIRCFSLSAVIVDWVCLSLGLLVGHSEEFENSALAFEKVWQAFFTDSTFYRPNWSLLSAALMVMFTVGLMIYLVRQRSRLRD